MRTASMSEGLQTSTSGRQVVAYHYPCPDGVFAALAAHLHFKQAGSNLGLCFAPNRVFAPCSVTDLNLKERDTLYLLDYVGPGGFAETAAKQAGRVIVLDHHKTALEAFADRESLPSNLEVNLDMERSGATMSFDYFQPQVSEVQRRLFKYIEDADLWRWALPDSKAFHAGFGALGLELDANKNPGIFDELLSLEPAIVISKGKEVEEELNQQISRALSEAFVVNLGGATRKTEGWGQCLAVKVEPPSKLGNIRSQLGNALAEEADRRGLRSVGLVAYFEAEMKDPSKIKCSLRSKGEEDTTLVSKAFGGGGHRNASSFILDVKEFRTWRLDK